MIIGRFSTVTPGGPPFREGATPIRNGLFRCGGRPGAGIALLRMAESSSSKIHEGGTGGGPSGNRIELAAYREAVVLTRLFAAPRRRNHSRLPTEVARRIGVDPQVRRRGGSAFYRVFCT
ncbi:hypothetical protein [Streptomyces katsurahamanus]|uniref:Uncharacterized protein n=1 Tax=Streptomyces katsurahamanus TaxID=2577098 RepID=A0ABW9P2R4_9ACTN|nr:hypothetical protein [Streptomyces katsurahamanus]MQS39893.1 hypothetical protein [Streptomyces katsurahamanus]